MLKASPVLGRSRRFIMFARHCSRFIERASGIAYQLPCRSFARSKFVTYLLINSKWEYFLRV